MFKSIRAKSTCLLGLLSLYAMSMKAYDTAFNLDFAFVPKNAPCNFISLSPAQLHQKLQDPQETKKIINFLIDPEFSDIITGNIEIYLQDIPNTEKISFFFREDILSHASNEQVLQILTNEFLANRQLVLDNKQIMQAIINFYREQIATNNFDHSLLAFNNALMTRNKFRVSLTDFFIDQIKKKDCYSQYFIYCILHFTTKLIEQNDHLSFMQIIDALSRNNTKIDNTALEIMLNPLNGFRI